MLAASIVYNNVRDGQDHIYLFKKMRRLEEIERYTCFVVSPVASNIARIAIYFTCPCCNTLLFPHNFMFLSNYTLQPYGTLFM